MWRTMLSQTNFWTFTFLCHLSLWFYRIGLRLFFFNIQYSTILTQPYITCQPFPWVEFPEVECLGLIFLKVSFLLEFPGMHFLKMNSFPNFLDPSFLKTIFLKLTFLLSGSKFPWAQYPKLEIPDVLSWINSQKSAQCYTILHQPHLIPPDPVNPFNGE